MKRFIGLVVAILLVVSLVPSVAFAEEAGAAISQEELTPQASAAPAEVILQEPALEQEELAPQQDEAPADIPAAITEALDELPQTAAAEAAAPEFEAQADETGVAGFVERLYKVVLGRNSDPVGKAAWINVLTAGTETGADVAHGFFFSKELIARGLTDSEFIDICYQTLLNRGSDPTGKAAWLANMNNGTSRSGIFYGFANSPEFTSICESYGIQRGDASKYREPRDINSNITAFVVRLYQNFLGRSYDPAGLNTWVEQLLSGATGVHVASGFFYSPEAQTLTQDQLIDACYRAFLGREPDAAGRTSWQNSLNINGYGTDFLFYGFTMSPEFTGICTQYGIIQGTAPMYAPPAAVNQPTTSITGIVQRTTALTVFDTVNTERQKAGVAALKWDNDLAEAAELRAAECAVLFSHTRPSGKDWDTVSNKAYGENIAMHTGEPSPSYAMQMWMNSSGHRENILRTGYTTIGVGSFTYNGTTYYVQLFGYNTDGITPNRKVQNPQKTFLIKT
ncbi:MAG: DUF4214 domain-containing protein [Christensenellaceae bacterium]